METDGRTSVCGILANPVGHSMSPALQNLYAECTGVNLTYVPFKVESEQLEAAVKGAFALNVLGMSVTVPHKQAVMRYLDGIDGPAEAIGAVNTLVRTEKGYKGYNTDMPGLLRAVTEADVVIKDRECILIGAGGAANAAAYMLAQEGASLIYILNRSVEKAEELAACLNEQFHRELARPMALSDYARIPDGRYIAVQTTSVGMYPNTEAAPIEDEAFYAKISEGVDVIYTPLETQFMKRVKRAGGRAVNGLGMLLYQGVIAFELWNPGAKVDAWAVGQAREKLLALLEAQQKKTPQGNQQPNEGTQEKLRQAEGSSSGNGAAFKNLVLIGFMGAGKTSVGMAYAAGHEIPIVDTDRLIEMTSRMSISQIFEVYGETEFRKRETQMLKNLLNADLETKKRTVISAGGGLPLRPENAALLRELGTVIYLKASVDTVLERLKGDITRPLLQGGDASEKAQKLMADREPYYIRAAHAVVEVDGKTLEEIVREIEELESRCAD